MKTQIDIKSAFCGLIVGVLAMFAIGAATSTNETGRYQVAAGQNSAVIVDTATGKAWAFQPISSAQYKTDGNFWEVK
ncbi:MAG: hypothetical protein WDM76_18815 [Limisphaerales bacterium]